MKLIVKFTFLSIVILLTQKIYSSDYNVNKKETKLAQLKEIIFNDDASSLKTFIEKNKIHWSKSINSDKDTLLHVAVNFGSIACVKFLLTLKDININKKNSLKLDIFKTASGVGQTPFEQATYWAKFPQRKNAEEILELLANEICKD